MPIMHSRYREAGTPKIDRNTCTGCGACARICPPEMLVMEDGNARVEEGNPLGCLACGHCMMVCPNGSVTVTGRGVSPDDLVPLAAPEQRASADALEALMRARRSVRHFTDEEVAPELLERVVAMASSAPMGIPPWDVGCVVVRPREKVRELAAEIIKGYEGFLRTFKPWVIKAMRPLLGKVKYDMFAHFIRPLAEMYVQGRREGRDMLFYDAPAFLLFHHSPYSSPVDATIACTYAMLAAESLGLGSTVIGGAPPVLERNRKLAAELGVPEGNTPCLSMIVGHPAVEFRRAIRRRFL